MKFDQNGPRFIQLFSDKVSSSEATAEFVFKQVRATKGSLLCGRKKGGSEGFMNLKARPTPAGNPTSIPYTPIAKKLYSDGDQYSLVECIIKLLALKPQIFTALGRFLLIDDHLLIKGRTQGMIRVVSEALVLLWVFIVCH